MPIGRLHRSISNPSEADCAMQAVVIITVCTPLPLFAPLSVTASRQPPVGHRSDRSMAPTAFYILRSIYDIDTPRNGLAFYRKARQGWTLACPVLAPALGQHAETHFGFARHGRRLPICRRKCTATAALCFRPARCTPGCPTTCARRHHSARVTWREAWRYPRRSHIDEMV